MWRSLKDWIVPDSIERLPAPVIARVREQQDRSEILIGWVQLGIFVTFAALYTLAPQTAPDGAGIAPVPMALGLYFAFTLLRIALAHARRLPDALVHVSIVVDMGLLMFTIWSFHIQYGQPPSFVLKAPTLLYVFIFIALRALRFEVRFVLLAGLAAALGWAIVIAAVLHAEHGTMPITRDYVAYMTSNALLLGAEFDKIISILMVTAIVALALTRARNLMIRAIAEQTYVNALTRFFDPEVADRIRDAGAELKPGEGVQREAAILFVDIRAFTRRAAERAPNEVIAELAAYQARLVPAIQDAGGIIDKFLGDGIMASFGAALEADTPVADALRAAEMALAAADAWNGERAQAGAAPLDIRAAVAAGPVIFGAVGEAQRLEFTVIGDPVNLAAKLEKHSKAEAALLVTDADTLRLAKAQGYVPALAFEPRAARAIEGLAEPRDIAVVPLQAPLELPVPG